MNETYFTVTGSELRGCTKGRERICLPNTTKQTEATNCICGNHGVSKKSNLVTRLVTQILVRQLAIHRDYSQTLVVSPVRQSVGKSVVAHNCRSCHALQICPSCRVRARKLWRALATNACPVAKFETQHVKRVQKCCRILLQGGILIICQSFQTCCCVCRFDWLSASIYIFLGGFKSSPVLETGSPASSLLLPTLLWECLLCIYGIVKSAYFQ